MKNYCEKCGKKFNKEAINWFTPKHFYLVYDPTFYGVCPHGVFFSKHALGGVKVIEKPGWFKEEMLQKDK